MLSFCDFSLCRISKINYFQTIKKNFWLIFYIGKCSNLKKRFSSYKLFLFFCTRVEVDHCVSTMQCLTKIESFSKT